VIRTGLALVAAAVTVAASAYREGPPPGHTGAFGEPDCGACHFDGIRDDDAGALRIGVPGTYRPGGTYEVTVTVTHPDLPAAGFQVAARFTGGPSAGGQAGRLEPAGERTRVQVGENGVVYASHSDRGVAPSGDGNTVWTLRWTAPDSGGEVSFDAAAQVANDDNSEFGERLYLASESVRPETRGR
jgi:hypothetical protein